MTNTELFDLWRARAVEDPDLLTELDGIRSDADAINDRFYRDLARAVCAASSAQAATA